MYKLCINVVVSHEAMKVNEAHKNFAILRNQIQNVCISEY